MLSLIKSNTNAHERRHRYRQHSDYTPELPLFSRGWWLDAAAGEKNWDAVFVEKGENIIASMPFVISRSKGFVKLTQPALTQALGPWISDSTASYAKKLQREKELLTALFNKLPNHHVYSQNWHHQQMNWLPLHWQGYEQTTRYTYRLPDISDENYLWTNFLENIRREIRKAENRFSLIIRDDLTIDDFLDLHEQTFSRQGKKIPYSKELVKKIDTACMKRKSRKIFIAEDNEGNRHSGVYIVWDENAAYYLMGGSNPAFRTSGAASLCMWEAIRFSATVSNSFDFEGSMLEPIERFFRSFGARQTPYHNISSVSSNFLKIILFYKNMFQNKSK